jgi:hypothetical protein
MFSNFKRGVLAARGELVTFCHDDDVILPEFVARSVAMLDQNPEIGFSGCNYDFIDERGAKIAERREIARTETWDDLRYIRALVARGRNPLTMQSVFYRRSVFGPEGFDDTIPLHFGDFVILMRMAEGRRVGFLADTLVQVRQHAAQASNAMPMSTAIPLRTKLLGEYFDEHLARHPDHAGFVRELRRLNERAHRMALAWGWAAAQTGDEARACADALDGGAATVLRGLDRLGVRSIGLKAQLAQRVRRVAGSLGL